MVEFPGLGEVNIGWTGLGISALGVLVLPILWILSAISTLLFPVWIILGLVQPSFGSSSSE